MTTNTSTAARTSASQNNSPQIIAPGSGGNNSPDLLAFTTPHPVDQHEIQFDISQRRKGVCKFFNSQKGFGFINDDHPEELGNQEVFVHYTSIGSKGGFRSLAEGEEVEYVVAPGQKGFQATEVTGPSGRAVQGDVKSKLPKTPTFVPYPMGIMPAGAYAIAGAGSPYMQPDPYMSAPGVYGSPYAGQVFYMPSAVGVLPGAHSPNLAAASSYPAATSPHASIRSPTIPFTHHQHGPMAMSLSPQPGAGGFGFGSPSMAYGFGGPASAGVVGTPATASAAAAEMRSPLMSGGGNSGVVGQGGFGAAQAGQSAFGVGSHNHGLGLRGDTNAGVGSSTDQIHHRGGPSGSGGAHHHQLGGFSNAGAGGSLLYTTTSGVPVNHQ